jgi:hypothetical protein
VGEAAEKSEFMNPKKALLGKDPLGENKVTLEKSTAPVMHGTSLDALAFPKIPQGAEPIQMSEAFAPDSKELQQRSPTRSFVPDKEFHPVIRSEKVPPLLEEAGIFVPTGDRKVELKASGISPNDVGKNSKVLKAETPVSDCRISMSGIVGAKPLSMKQPDISAKSPPLHLVGGSQEPPKPPKAPAAASSSFPEPEKKPTPPSSSMEKITDMLRNKAIMRMEEKIKALTEENKTLGRMVARLYSEIEAMKEKAI